MTKSGVPPPPGWYSDPSYPSRLRWWSGTTWTNHIQVSAEASSGNRVLSSLPWRTWGAWFGAIGAVGFVCFGEFEAKGTSRPEVWFWAGLCLSALIVAVGSAFTLRNRSWLAVLVFALLAASIITLTIFATAAPATSTSCNSASDCDTSYGFGVPFMVVVFLIPTFVVAAIGKLAGKATRIGT